MENANIFRDAFPETVSATGETGCISGKTIRIEVEK